jgi:hypothetical protein
LVDGKKLAEGRLERTIPFRISADETLDIGEDTGTPVSEDYHCRLSSPEGAGLPAFNSTFGK